MSDSWKCQCGRTVPCDARPETRYRCDSCGELRDQANTPEIVPDADDLARDLRADYEAISGPWGGYQYDEAVLGWPAALRRAIATEARVKELEQTLLGGIEQLKSMRAETDRLSHEAALFGKILGVQE